MKKAKVIEVLNDRINSIKKLMEKNKQEGKDTSYYEGMLYAYKDILKDIKNEKF